MAGFNTEQRRLTHRGRSFLFVSYEAQDGDAARPAMPETWYLVSSGNRWPAIPVTPEQPVTELDERLAAWLESAVFAPVPAPVAGPPA